MIKSRLCVCVVIVDMDLPGRSRGIRGVVNHEMIRPSAPSRRLGRRKPALHLPDRCHTATHRHKFPCAFLNYQPIVENNINDEISVGDDFEPSKPTIVKTELYLMIISIVQFSPIGAILSCDSRYGFVVSHTNANLLNNSQQVLSLPSAGVCRQKRKQESYHECPSYKKSYAATDFIMRSHKSFSLTKNYRALGIVE